MKQKLFLYFSLFILLLNCEKKKEKWVKLFNGKDLKDWVVKIKGHPAGENYNNTFIAEDGVMKVNYEKYKDSFHNTFGHIYYKKPFSNYKFRMDYRFTGEQLSDGADWATRNSGIMLHCEDPMKIGLDQNFPVSIEVQLLGGNGTDERQTANLCTPGTNVVIDSLRTEHCIKSTSKTYHGEQWVNVEIEVRNDSIIKHFINGEEVMRYYKPQYGGGNVDYNEDYWKSMEGQPLKGGYISLQSESHPVEFRNIEILEL
ncbi:MAG: 3-keto-disaccharide hydrolase [Jejuia sp.]